MKTIRRNSTNSVFSREQEANIDINVLQTTKKMPFTDINEIVDQYDVYRSESAACNKYRLTLTLKPYCTNVLFNTCTEVMYKEGSDDVVVAGADRNINLNDIISRDAIKTVGGNTMNLTLPYMVENTEYSSKNIGFEYHPGMDIFGNHLLRNMTFRSVVPLLQSSSSLDKKNFNTLSDVFRTFEGKKIKTFIRDNDTDGNPKDKHLYDKEMVLSMKDGESVEVNLTNDNGWFGFYNNSSITSKIIEGKNVSERDISHIINNKGNCEFIDMYPDRTLFSFNPKINKYKRRLEKNWDMFITYPYENFYKHNLVTNVYGYSQEENVKIIPYAENSRREGDRETNALLVKEAKALTAKNGMRGVQFRSYCKHNLIKNSNVVIYRSLNDGVSFEKCESVFRVEYVGDMKNNGNEYYFTITDSSILDEIFKDEIVSNFYATIDNTTNDCLIPTSQVQYKIVNGEVTEIPQDIDTDDTSYIPDIHRYYYEMEQNNISTAPIGYIWDDSNTVDDLPLNVEGSPSFIRQRQKIDGEYVYSYYKYDNGNYVLLSQFNPATEIFGEGNTCDDVPVSTYITDYIRVHEFVFYKKKDEFIYQCRNEETIEEKINRLLATKIQLRFAKVDGDVKCEYYIRKFKKLPNFNHIHEELTDEIAKNRIRFNRYIEDNASKEGKMRNFDNEQYPLSFSKTIYNDDITQYQFTENFEIDKIRDNLGRPLTEMFVTVVKKNTGYMDWYLKQRYSDYEDNGEMHKVEFSHCFGKLTSGLDLFCNKNDDTIQTRIDKGELSDSQLIHNELKNQTILSSEGYYSLEWWEDRDAEGVDENTEVFFGDVVEYNPAKVLETVLSDVQFRFNTAQREIGDENQYKFQFKEIKTDDYEKGGFELEAYEEDKGRNLHCPEGYYYKAHYSIGLKSFGTQVRQASHYSVLFSSASPIQMQGIFIRVVTKNNHGYSEGKKLFICNDSEGIWYNSNIVSVDSKKSFIISPISKDVETYEGKPYINWIDICELLNNGELCIRVANENIPDYADNIGRNLFLWRDIIPASESEDETINTYPFANGALYIDKSINFYLKRQDPEDINGLYYRDEKNSGAFADRGGKIIEESNYEYIPESETIC